MMGMAQVRALGSMVIPMEPRRQRRTRAKKAARESASSALDHHKPLLDHQITKQTTRGKRGAHTSWIFRSASLHRTSRTTCTIAYRWQRAYRWVSWAFADHRQYEARTASTTHGDEHRQYEARTAHTTHVEYTRCPLWARASRWRRP